MQIAPGMNFGHYQIIAPIGMGGMGRIFRAHDTRLDRDVAIKALPAAFSNDPDRLSRFVDEAKILASLNHPNIAAIYGLEQFAGIGRCLILELVDGESLAECLNRGPLQLEEALRVCADVAGALEAAHERGVIHRDLKPRNIMVSDKGNVKLLDFGLARQLTRPSRGKRPSSESSFPELQNGDETITLPSPDEGEASGTPGYMSPEQVNGEDQDQRSDIFAFGCLLYECLTGRRAFSGDSLIDTMTAVLTSEPDWNMLPADTPAGVQDLLVQCTQKDKTVRLGSIVTAREELDGARGLKSGLSVPPSSVPNNLPRDSSSFIGRERELEECAALLREFRLVTLTGIGGCGKTRLALKVAEGAISLFPGGVWFVDLAPIMDSNRVFQAVGTALNITETPARSLNEALIQYLAGKHALIVLDNCEHLLSACRETADRLLTFCPGLKLIATSRESFGMKAERVFPVPPMSVPPQEYNDDEKAVRTSEAGRLFLQRAREIDSKLELNALTAPVIAEICLRLDGIPLAIELAAARVKMLTLEQIRGKLHDRFRLLSAENRADDVRHRTLRETIDWSYDHLVAEEQQMFRSLAVFVGGWTLSAATDVAGRGMDEFAVLDVLTRLADKSLITVNRSSGQEARYMMLETVREFASDRLTEAGEKEELRARHFRYFLSLAQEFVSHRFDLGGAEWRAKMDYDLDNFLSAHAWCNESEDRSMDGLHLAYSMRSYWLPRGLLGLGRRISAEALNRPGAEEPSFLRGKMLLTAGVLSYFVGRYDDAGKYLGESLIISRQHGEKSILSTTLTGLALVAVAQRRNNAAMEYLHEAVQIARDAGERGALSSALNSLGDVYRAEANYSAAVASYDEARTHAIALGNMEDAGVTLCNLGRVWIMRGETDRAREVLRELLDRAPHIASQHVSGGILDVAAALAVALRNWGIGVKLYGTADALMETAGYRRDIIDESFIAPLIARARESMGEADFHEAYTVGRDLTFESSVDDLRRLLRAGADN